MREFDITNLKFGKLTAIEKVESKLSGKQKRSTWLFKCDCGNLKEINKHSVMRGLVVSCGCYLNEIRGSSSLKHGLSDSRLYQCWLDMKHRCYYDFSKNSKEYKSYRNYGGRGIKVCEEWLDESFGSLNFINWSLNNGYSDKLTLDRINVNGDYEPSNCRWISVKEQCRNKRNNRFLEIGGVRMILKDWMNLYNINRNTFYYRKKKGLSDEEALTKVSERKIK